MIAFIKDNSSEVNMFHSLDDLVEYLGYEDSIGDFTIIIKPVIGKTSKFNSLNITLLTSYHLIIENKNHVRKHVGYFSDNYFLRKEET